MELKELREISKIILGEFVDEIGLDGEFYESICNCPLAYGIPQLNYPGEFVIPETERLKNFIERLKASDDVKKVLAKRGVIIINSEYKYKEDRKDMIITAIHEIIHSNRDLLLYDSVRDGKNENSYVYNNGKFEQTTNKMDFSHVDASQEVLKGNIDNSRKTIDKYKNMKLKELDTMEYTEKGDSKFEDQIVADEALVDVMANLSYKLYSLRQKGEEADIWKIIEELKDKFIEAYEEDKYDVEKHKSVICKIILKHHDFELFYWMLDPISYSQGDIHYDFFKDYTKNDQDLLQELYEYDGIDLGTQKTNEMERE